MKSPEEWSKELGTYAIHCQGADEIYPRISLEEVKAIQDDARKDLTENLLRYLYTLVKDIK